jgi:hypothetical protein
MSKRKSKISTQEAALRLSLGIHEPWENLVRGQILALHRHYCKIIGEVASMLEDYESSLADICRGVHRLSSINPFSSDHHALDLKAKAIDDAGSLLRSHGLPFPLPVTIAGLQRLKKEWPSIKVRRRRAIRTQKCKELSLPLNYSWEQVLDEVSRRKRMTEQVAAERLRRQNHPSNIMPYKPDTALPSSLAPRINETAKHPKGYVYLKRWQMPGGVSWYKIGVTSNPRRRDSEQNVLPVPAETIACVEVESMERARSAESDFRRLGAAQQIRDASNRELFQLNSTQFSELQAAFIRLAGN